MITVKIYFIKHVRVVIYDKNCCIENYEMELSCQ